MKIKRLMNAALLVLALSGGAAALLTGLELMRAGGAEAVRDLARELGEYGGLFAVGLQALQIVVAVIPGEVVESGLGFAFGAVKGTVYCYIGLLLGQWAVFWLIRRYGTRALYRFVGRERAATLSILKNERRLVRLAFILFLLPGTPKDLFCYLFPLSDISAADFLTVSMVARFPSVITSTWGGSMLAVGDLRGAVLLYLITGGVSLAGMWAYRTFIAKKEKKIKSP